MGGVCTADVPMLEHVPLGLPPLMSLGGLGRLGATRLFKHRYPFEPVEHDP